MITMNIDVSIFEGTKFYIFFNESPASLSFSAFYPRFWKHPSQEIMGVFGQSRVHFRVISRGFPNPGGHKHCPYSIDQGLEKYSDRVYQAEENLHKNNIKTLFFGDYAYPKTLTFCSGAPWFCFTWETSILVSVSSSASLVADPAISMGNRFVVNWSLV